MTIHERIDAAVAQIAYTVHASAGGRYPPEHFVPRWEKPRTWTEDEVFAWLDAVATKGVP